jgi:NADPH2:quinone reductase
MIGTGRTTVAILRQAGLTPDDAVLVPAAGGGIGTLLVQYARQLGATVVGAAGGPAETDRIRELGADLAVDYRRPDCDGKVRARLGADQPLTSH